MTISTTKKYRKLHNELCIKSKKLPLNSKEVVKVSQKLDLLIVQATKNQL